MWQGGGVLFLNAKVSQYLVYDALVFDADDDPDKTTAAGADRDVYVECGLDPLRPGHCCMTLGGCADFCAGGELDAFPAPGWRDQVAPTPVVPGRCGSG